MDTPPSTPAAPRKRLHQNPLVQIGTVLIVQACTLLASNYKAKVEARAKAEAVHLQAEAGYSVMVEAVRKLGEKDAEQAIAIAKLEGQVQILAQQFDHHRAEWKPVIRAHAPEPAEPSAYDALARVQRAVAPPAVKMRIPTDLEQAVQWGQKKQ